LLTNAKIVAHGTNTYKKTLFNSTIFAGIGAYPQLTCERNKQGSHDLLEIRVCLDKKGLSYQNCTEPSNSCGQDIILPLWCDMMQCMHACNKYSILIINCDVIWCNVCNNKVY